MERALDADISDHDVVVTAQVRVVACDETETETHAGSALVHIIRADTAMETGERLYEACDAHSETLSDYCRTIYKGSQIREDIERDLAPTLGANALILDRIELLPEHRGRRLGLAIAWRLIDTFEPGCGLVVCEPFPMQFGGPGEDADWRARMRADTLAGTKELARAKLAGYWSRLGFKPIPGTKYLALNLSLQRPSPRDAILDA